MCVRVRVCFFFAVAGGLLSPHQYLDLPNGRNFGCFQKKLFSGQVEEKTLSAVFHVLALLLRLMVLAAALFAVQKALFGVLKALFPVSRRLLL